MGFPNLRNKHKKDAIITPSEYSAYMKSIGNYPKIKPPVGVIFFYERSLIKHILENYKTKKVEGLYSNMYLIDDTNGKVAIVGSFGIGSPAASAMLEDLIFFGVKKFITIGFAGTLQKNLKIGSLVVCEKSIRDEGTSYHYIKPSKYAYASKEITNKIIKSLEKFKKKYVVGTSWTIDAPYRETVAEARQYQKEGVLTVEMEASSLFAVAKYRNVDIGAIFVVSDSIAELQWNPKFFSKKSKSGLETIFKVSVDVLNQE